MNNRHLQKNVFIYTYQIIALVMAVSCGAIVLSISTVSAESLYVAPSAEVAIRRGQGTEYKIVAMVKSGTRVEFLEDVEHHTKVRLASGKEGWMLSRFLSPDPPLDQVVDRLQLENDKLKEKSAKAAEKIAELTLALSTTQDELAALRRDREQLGQDYETLQKDTADVVQIKKDLDSTVGENSALLEKLALLEEQYKALKKDSKMYWFLAGAGVLIVGLIFGKLPSPARRRKSSLL